MDKSPYDVEDWFNMEIDEEGNPHQNPNAFYCAGYRAHIVRGKTQAQFVREGTARVREWLMGFADALADSDEDSSLVEAAIRKHYGIPT